jgi:hypothetical protein
MRKRRAKRTSSWDGHWGGWDSDDPDWCSNWWFGRPIPCVWPLVKIRGDERYSRVIVYCSEEVACGRFRLCGMVHLCKRSAIPCMISSWVLAFHQRVPNSSFLFLRWARSLRSSWDDSLRKRILHLHGSSPWPVQERDKMGDKMPWFHGLISIIWISGPFGISRSANLNQLEVSNLSSEERATFPEVRVEKRWDFDGRVSLRNGNWGSFGFFVNSATSCKIYPSLRQIWRVTDIKYSSEPSAYLDIVCGNSHKRLKCLAWGMPDMWSLMPIGEDYWRLRRERKLIFLGQYSLIRSRHNGSACKAGRNFRRWRFSSTATAFAVAKELRWSVEIFEVDKMYPCVWSPVVSHCRHHSCCNNHLINLISRTRIMAVVCFESDAAPHWAI